MMHSKPTRAPEGITWEDLTREEVSEAEEEYDFDQKSESVNFDDSDSDEGMVSYWLQDAKESIQTQQKAIEDQEVIQPESSKVASVSEAKMKESVATDGQQKSSPQVEEQYTHLLYIPFHTSTKFKKRCDTFANNIISSQPGFEPYLTVEQSKINVIPLKISDFQIDIVQQLMQYGGIFEKNVECKTNPGKSGGPIGKVKVELRGVEAYKIVDSATLNNTGWLKETHRGPIISKHSKKVKYELSVKKGSGWDKVELLVNNAISKLIELGIANERHLKGARFDISQMMYKLEDPRVNIMEFEDEVNLLDLKKIKDKYDNFNFQHAELNQMVFAAIDQEAGTLNPISTAQIK